MNRDASDARYRQLLDDRRELLRIRYSDHPRDLDEIEVMRLRAIRFELDILDYDSPHGQWLDAQLRALDKFEAVVSVKTGDLLTDTSNLLNATTELKAALRR